MFSTAPIGIVPAPLSPEAQKLVDAIRDQTDGVPAHLVFVLDIVSVRFGGYFTPQIKAEIQKFSYLQMLTLNDCGLKSLTGFPHLPGLIRLDLVFNQITGESLNSLKGSRHLQTLMLGANRIQKFQHLQQLSSLRQIVQLDLINNPVSKLPGYRQKMFNIFPTMTILDTLDKSGKDAYTSSSMALTVSRVPDVLFDKSPSVPVIPPPPPVSIFSSAPAPIPSSIPKPVASSKPSTALAPSSSRASLSRHGSKDIKMKDSSKKQKKAKLGKSAKLGKISRSASSRAGLIFPIGRLKRRLKYHLPNTRVSKNASVYLAATLEYLTAQILQIAGNLTKQQKKHRITPSYIKRCLKNDQQLYKLLNGITLSMGGQ